MIIGQCPFCEEGFVEDKKIEVNGKKVIIYKCNNANWEFESDIYVLTSDSSCSFRIFSNQLKKYNKNSLGKREIQQLLENNELIVDLYRRKPYFEEKDGIKQKKHKHYKKKIIPHKEYGIEILFNEEI